MAVQSANLRHGHIFLRTDHEHNERRTWWVVWICIVMMLVEIVGGFLSGSIALIADGVHMSTHAGALLLTALAYRYARKHVHDPRFSFGTGKIGDLAGFSSAIVMAMIAVVIGFEAVRQFFAPMPVNYTEALPIAGLALLVNVITGWILIGGHSHHHEHHSMHTHPHITDHEYERKSLFLNNKNIQLEIYERGVPPRFRIYSDHATDLANLPVSVETVRPNGQRHVFLMATQKGYLESVEEIPEPHEFSAIVDCNGTSSLVQFSEHEHTHESIGRDNNMRAAIAHIVTDSAVSALVVVGLWLGFTFNWLWMNPLAAIVGAIVIGNWAYGLVRDTAKILLDMTPDQSLAQQIQEKIEMDGDTVSDLHLWRLGPGHLGAILSVQTSTQSSIKEYQQKLSCFRSISHLTIEIYRTEPPN